MKRRAIFCLFALLALPYASAEDWTSVPPGKARVIIYGDVVILGGLVVQTSIDNEPEFSYNILSENLVLDLPPGRHTIKLTYRSLVHTFKAHSSFVLSEGDLIYLRYALSGVTSNYWLSMVTSTKFEAATRRPLKLDPVAGGKE